MRVNLDTLRLFLKIAAANKESLVLKGPEIATASFTARALIGDAEDQSSNQTAAMLSYRDAKAIVDAHKGADSADLTWTAHQASLSSGLAVTTVQASEAPDEPASEATRPLMASVPGASLALAGWPLLDVLAPKFPRSYASLLRLEASQDSLKLVACDGFRIMTSDLAVTNGPQTMVPLAIAYDDARRLFALADVSENLDISLSDDLGLLKVTGGPFTLAIKTSAASYPNYARVIPDKLPARPFDRKILLAQIKKLLPSCAKKEPSVRVVNMLDKTLLQVPDSQAFAMVPFALGDELSAPLYLNPFFLVDALSCDKSPVGSLSTSMRAIAKHQSRSPLVPL